MTRVEIRNEMYEIELKLKKLRDIPTERLAADIAIDSLIDRTIAMLQSRHDELLSIYRN